MYEREGAEEEREARAHAGEISPLGGERRAGRASAVRGPRRLPSA